VVLMRSVLSSIYDVVSQNSQVFVLPLFIQPHRAQRLGIHSLNSPSKNFGHLGYLTQRSLKKNVFSAEDESIARPLALLLRKLFEFLEACRVQVENKKLQLWVSWESYSYFYAVRYLNLARSQKTKRRVEWAFLSAKLTFSFRFSFQA
jgi:hypothetical protein